MGQLTLLRVLTWRLWKSRLCRPFSSLLELLLPAMPLALLLYLYSRAVSQTRPPPSPHHTDPVFLTQLYEETPPRGLFYAPNSSYVIKDLLDRVADTFQLESFDVEGFASEEDLLLNKGRILQSDSSVLGIIFQNVSTEKGQEILRYSIRSSRNYDTSRLTPAIQIAGPHEQYGRIYESFVALQMAIDTAFIERVSSQPITKKLSLQAFPYPAFEQDETAWIKFSAVIPATMVLGFLMPFLSSVARLLSDKDTGIKELMKMMGVPRCLLWTSHYANSGTALGLVVLACVLLLKLGPAPLVPGSSSLLLLFSLLLYSAYIIMFAFAFSTLFSKSLAGCVTGSVVWLGSLVMLEVPTLPSRLLPCLLLSLLPNAPLFWLFQIIGVHEMRENGLHFNNLLTFPKESALNILFVWFLFIVYTALFALIAWYVDQVNPGSYGVPKPWMFPFMKLWRKVSPDIQKKNEIPGRMDIDKINSRYIETHAPNAEYGVTIRNIYKEYGGHGQVKKMALNNVSLDIHEGSITVLLGHNGAGKTTLMSILTGMCSATSGTFQVHRKGIGLCPQHNLTFPDLTLKQHLIFFSKLKGMSETEAEKEATSVLRQMGLEAWGSWACGRLSGGQRRRAQLGMALVGSPALLVLDEPTTGLDPCSRRQLWDVLLEIRKKHTILITTHFMEEADVLGDYVAILDHGQLRCYGTPMFLKTAYNTGYTLNMLSKGNTEDVDQVVELVKKVPQSQLQNKENGYLRFRLPSDSAPGFPKLFQSLEKLNHITSVGLSLTTLEEIFLRVTGHEEEEDVVDGPGGRKGITGNQEETQKLRQPLLMVMQVFGLLVRRLLYLASDFHIFLFEVLVMGLLFSLPLLGLGGAEVKVGSSPPLLLSPELYGPGGRLLYSTNSSSPNPLLPSLTAPYGLKLKHSHEDSYLAILREGEADPKRSYTGDLQLALALYEDSYVGLYSTSTFHTLPVIAGLLSNLLAADMMGPPVSSVTRILTINHPVPAEGLLNQMNSKPSMNLADIMTWASCLTVGCFFMVAVWLVLVVRERTDGSRQLLQLAGPSPLLYWAVALLLDSLVTLVFLLIFVLITCTFDPWDTFTFQYTLGPLMTMMFGFTVSGLSWVYCFSLAVRSASAGYILQFTLTLIIGVLVSVIQMVALQWLGGSNGALHVLCSLTVPAYSLNQGLMRLGLVAQENMHCLHWAARKNFTDLDNLCCGKDEVTGECFGLMNFYTDKQYGLSENLLFMFVSTLLYLTILMLYEYKIWQKLWERCINMSFEYPNPKFNDEDVNKETKNVEMTINNSDLDSWQFLMHRLAKRYKRRPCTKGHVGLKDLNIAIKKGECFGLLGANGAGKSTTFRMVVGEDVPSKGRCLLPGGSRRGALGYCPQFDALDPFLTGRQVLTLFCRLRGVPLSYMHTQMDSMLKMAGLEEFANTTNCQYSGGNRRKLSACVALEGGRYGGGVVLDEPSAGVDPHSRLALHTLIRSACTRGGAILLSSHSMEECEKLVSRLGILSGGELACVGPVQHLKERFGTGYLLTVRIRACPIPVDPLPLLQEENIDTVDSPSEDIPLVEVTVDGISPLARLKDSISEIPGCQLRDQRLSVLQFHITEKSSRLSDLFSYMEGIKRQHGALLEDYTISCTTLEQVFLSFSGSSQEEGTLQTQQL